MQRLNVIQQYLDEQQDLRAVQRFSKRHETMAADSHSGIYRSSIPLTAPGPGKQYAFSVDLDACTGCKACVVACNKLNGLDSGETWRSVGLLHGGSEQRTIQQTVTTGCHHCVDPGCLSGCPVNAYEKDPKTGIVRHLDDQCIGCQYCTLTCPYEVPQYNSRLGIVRKCDMCSERLAEGEAPACVQACPNNAIAITVVDQAEVVEEAQADRFLPGAPSPGITIPTTCYTSEKPLPRNVLPADFYSVRPAKQHWPLVVMLVLNQLAVGAICVDAVLGEWVVSAAIANSQKFHALLSLCVGVLAIVASVFHLGRPQYAFRAVLGFRHSWLSREAVAFGAFVGAAFVYAAVSWFGGADDWGRLMRFGVAFTGVVGIACSVMVYRATKRVFWNGGATATKFLLSALVLGAATLLATSFVVEVGWPQLAENAARGIGLLSWVLAASMTAKLLYELGIFAHLRDRRQTDLKRTAMLMRGELVQTTRWRFGTGTVGGVLLPIWLQAVHGTAFASVNVLAFFAVAACILVLSGELLERLLFFTAVSAPRMPGAVGR